MAEVQLGPPIFLSQLCQFLLLGCWPKPKHAFSGTLFPLCSLAFLPAMWLSDHVADFYVVLSVTHGFSSLWAAAEIYSVTALGCFPF